MHRRRWLAGLAAMVPLAFTALGAQAELRYRIQELPYAGGVDSSEFFDPHALNNRGQVVGYVQQEVEEDGVVNYLWTAHVSRGTRLEPLVGTGAFRESNANGINDRGQIVGEYWAQGSPSSVPFFYANGQYRDLRVDGKDGQGRATDLNELGQAVGQSGSKAFFFDGTHSRYIDIPGARSSIAQALNDHGAVVGSASFNVPGGTEDRAFVYDGQNVQFLDSPVPGQRSPTLADINNAGQMVGTVFGSGGSRYGSYLYDADGKFTNIGSLTDNPAGTVARALNDQGWVVGNSPGGCDIYFNCQEAFIHRDGHMSSLNDLLSPKDAPFWHLIDAVDINERGQILGTGLHYDAYYSTFLLTPVPEPRAWALLLAGLGLVGMTAARRRPQDIRRFRAQAAAV